MAPDGDVRVELVRAGRDPLAILAVHHRVAPIQNQQRSRLEHVPGRIGSEHQARPDPSPRLDHLYARAHLAPRWSERHGRSRAAVDPQLAERRVDRRRGKAAELRA